MFKHKFTEPVRVSVQIHWFILAFLAGSLNAGGWMACHRFVSHVTGFATLAGVELFNGGTLAAFSILSIPAFFLGGVILSAFLIESQTDSRGRYRSYAWIMGLVALATGVVVIGGALEWFGPFGEPASLRYDYLLQALLCGACGLQNGVVTSSSGGTVRVTHLTGVTTDLGLGLVRAVVRLRSGEQTLPWEVKVNFFRACSITAFIFGSGIGAAAFYKFAYWGFLFPMAIAIYVTVVAYLQIDKEDDNPQTTTEPATDPSLRTQKATQHGPYR